MAGHGSAIIILLDCKRQRCAQMLLRSKCRNGFTLVEMLVVIIIIGVLAGILMLASAYATDKSKETACLNNRKVIEKDYMIDKAGESGRTFMDIIADIIKDDPRLVLSSISSERAIFTNVCPSESTVAATLTSKDTVVVDCLKHTGKYTESATESLASNIYNQIAGATFEVSDNNKNRNTLDKYFSQKKVGDTLDSTGPNFGQKISAQLGIDLSKYSWMIQKTGDKKYVYYFASNTSVANTAIGTRINVTKYDPATGTYIYGTASVTIKTDKGNTVNINAIGNDFVAD